MSSDDPKASGDAGSSAVTLLGTAHIAGDLESHLGSAGQIFARFFQQDSGCQAYGVEIEGGRYFVKASVEKRAVPSLRRAEVLHRSVTHKVIIPLVRTPGSGPCRLRRSSPRWRASSTPTWP